MVVRLSTVFRANRLTDFVRMSPMRPASASSTMQLKPSCLRVDVPEMPSSLYLLTDILQLRANIFQLCAQLIETVLRRFSCWVMSFSACSVWETFCLACSN